MAMKFIDLIRLILPLSKKQRVNIKRIKEFLDKKQLSQVKSLIKQKKVGISYTSLGVSSKIGLNEDFPQLNLANVNKEVEEYIKGINDKIVSSIKITLFKKYAETADIKQFIAPNIVGMEELKEAVALQLFSDKIHVLLLGDPGTGKTDILRSACELSTISSFGLGSGTTGAGLAVTINGKEVQKGLLPLANGGICCIDELNLMKQTDRASLYNAMEKGFVSYDKGGKHLKFDANIKVLATANPKGDKFVSRSVEIIRKQLPFEPALLSRFHVVFLVRRANLNEFVNITKNIIQDVAKGIKKEDAEFIKEYIDYSQKVNPELPKNFENLIIQFISEIKKNEKEYLIEVTPRLITGITRMAKARARMNLRESVDENDIEEVKKIILFSLKIKK